ncbi:MAG: hypothetical protein QOF73_1873, partial [Thermomicrobiales bacterium]|nr:hypothetical protein [Thermomicrobiales bacterium]
MTVHFDPHWSYRGFQALVFENALLRAVILPELGAKIWSLVLKPADREMLWHNPRLPPRLAPFGARYDDWFCGGWDELFPNDAPVTIGGEPYPDHGELWSMPFAWDLVTSTPSEVTIRLHRTGVVTPTQAEKWLTLRRDESLLRIRYAFANDGPVPLDFLWKLHPALAIGPDSRIDLPAGRVIHADGYQEGFAEPAFIWPHTHDPAGQPIDMRRIPPPTAATAHFYHAVELTDGWCALTDTRDRVGFGLAFDPAILSSVCIFGAYGGWRGLYTTILEP